MLNKSIIAALCLYILTAMAYSLNPDIPYYPEGTAPNPPKNMLDVYVPSGIIEAAPVLFFVHGGTWTYGDRSDYTAVGAYLADQEGYVTVVISYSLSDSLHPEVSHPDHILDVAQAFKWTVDNIADYGGDPSRIVVIGHSAGAHLATLLATNTRFLDSLSIGIESIKAVVSFNMGIYDIPKLYRDCGMLGPTGYSMMGFSAIFGPIADSSFNWYDASPKYHVSEETPPFVFFVSTADMEQIIGGDFGGYGVLILPGEVQFTYSDFRAYQPSDTFWLVGDHNSAFSDFVYDRLSRGRVLTMAFLDEVFTGIEEDRDLPTDLVISAHPNPFNSAVTISLDGAAICHSRESGNPEGVRVEIFDLAGRIVETLRPSATTLEKGGQEIQILEGGSVLWTPAPSVGSGVYLVRVGFGPSDVKAAAKRLVYLK